MKKIFLLFVAVILAACSAEPVENELNSLDAAASGKNKAAAAAEDPMGFYAGNSGNLKGTLEIWNDCDNLYVQITPTDENPDEVSIWLLNDLAQLNGGKNQVQNVPDVTESDPQDLLWMFPVNDFDVDEDLFIYVRAYSDYAGAISQEKVSYTDYDLVFEDCGCNNELTAELTCEENRTLTITFTAEEAGPIVIQGGLTNGTHITSATSNVLTQNKGHQSGNSNANVTRWEGDVEACEVVTITLEFTGGDGVGDWTAKRNEVVLDETDSIECSEE
jgi:hypothetical protein